MSRLFESLKPKAVNSRNAFDKSRRDIFSAKTGMLLPCFVEDTIPDSVYDVGVVNLLRTDSIQSAPFARMSQNMEYYFIPYSQLFKGFDKMFYERGDRQRNVTNQPAILGAEAAHVPNFNLSSVLNALWGQYVALRLTTEYRSSASSRLAAFDETQWLYVLDTYFGSLQSTEGQLNSAYVDIHGRLCVEDSLRLLDLLGYGNYLPAFKRLFNYGFSYQTIQDDLESLLSTEQSSAELLDVFGTCFYSFYSTPMASAYINGFSSRYVSVLRLAAYLKVWSDIYRNSQYDVSVDYSYYFNFDYAVLDTLTIIDYIKVCELLKPRYRQYKKDIFTGCYPTAQFGSVAVAATENPFELYAVNNNSHERIYLDTVNDSGNYTTDNSVLQISDDSYHDTFSSNQAVSALSIRQAMALQRYRERILRAGNRTTALQMAVFGDTSRYVKDDYVDFIGAAHANIDFNSVAATSESGSFSVGELASNGISTHGGDVFKFNCHDHGILLGMFYVLPETEYESYGIDMFNTMTESADFYKPDFANLGLAPVFNFNFNFLAWQSTLSSMNVNLFDKDAVLGYLARYWQYKTSVDKVHGEFYSESPVYDPIGVRTGSSIPTGTLAPFDSVRIGAFADFTTPRASQSFVQPFLKSLYVAPYDCDRIFYASSDEYQSSDQFKVNMNHSVKCILPMSVIGLPQ